MKTRFCIEYRTFGNEKLVVKEKCADGKECRHEMQSDDKVLWHCETDVAPDACYCYAVEDGSRELRHEWPLVSHGLDAVADEVVRCDVRDWWIDRPAETYLYSLAKTECVAAHGYGKLRPAKSGDAVVKVRAPQMPADKRLVLVGADEALGGWDACRGMVMTQVRPNEWAAVIATGEVHSQLLEFKFVAMEPNRADTAVWEKGRNRVLLVPNPSDGTVTVEEQTDAQFDIAPQRVAGTVVPVFSIRTEASFGIGDFGDLKKMVDWVAMTGQHALQLLPINDTTTDGGWMDSYPYNCISVFALHPIYADVSQLPALRDQACAKRLEAVRKELNALPQIDYERVMSAKMEWLRATYAESGKKLLETAEFERYFDWAKDWLVPYSEFCHYRDQYGTADSDAWSSHRTFAADSKMSAEALRRKGKEGVAFWCYVQFCLHKQMKAAHDYARSKQVVLKGDIPIGVSRCGADVWESPRYFNKNGQAGAPPDAFSVKGQNWGFPTYEWAEMKKDGYLWWKRRFAVMSEYFDAYRIDHVLGFFRIWEIPADAVDGLLGQFSPALGLTCAEIEGAGLRFDPKRMTEPEIDEESLAAEFGPLAAEVKRRYLRRKADGTYRLKPEVNTQRKIAQTVGDRQLCEGLQKLAADVLFVKDRSERGKYHPRIMGQATRSWKKLSAGDRGAFDRLYEDYYYHRNSQYWFDGAMEKLPALVESTRMLACAEDLGMVPECVPWALDRLGVLSLEIESMPKAFGRRFGDTCSYGYRSVCTISTHDMPTLRQWWDEDLQRTQEYYNQVLRHDGEAQHPLPGHVASEVVMNHLKSNSMLCLLSLQDWLAMDEGLRCADADSERINIPAESRHYWRWRMHMNVEELMSADGFGEKLRQMMLQAGR